MGADKSKTGGTIEAEHHSSTESHSGPEPRRKESEGATLVQVHPRLGCVPLRNTSGVVGRRWFRELGADDGEISSEQLCIRWVGGVLHINDIASRNGTWCDGERLEPQERVALVDGTVVRVGKSLFVYRQELAGSHLPSAEMGELVGPYGLRLVAQQVEAVTRHRPRCILISGPSGSGKELMARYLVGQLRPQQPVAAFNVAAVADGVFESQLFGHVAGAYSDARSDALGLLRAHDGGTVIFDEIGELGLAGQAKLLRFMDAQEILPVGGDRTEQVDVLLLACTNSDLEKAVKERGFRSDLLARLAMQRINMPGLCERGEDILSIAQSLSARLKLGLWDAPVEVEAVEMLLLNRWENNVRELESVLRCVAGIQGKPGLRAWSVREALANRTPVHRPLLTRQRVQQALVACRQSRAAAAKRLGVSRGRLLRYIARISEEDT